MNFGISNYLLSEVTPQRNIQKIEGNAIFWPERSSLLRDIFIITKFAPANPSFEIVFNSTKKYISFLASCFPSFQFTSYGARNDQVEQFKNIPNLRVKTEQFTSQIEIPKYYMLIFDEERKFGLNKDFKNTIKIFEKLKPNFACCPYFQPKEGKDIFEDGFLFHCPWESQKSYATFYVSEQFVRTQEERKYLTIDSNVYRRQLFYHHYEERKISFKTLCFDPPNLTNDYDSTYESYILSEYFIRVAASRNTKEYISKFSRIISQELGKQISNFRPEIPIKLVNLPPKNLPILNLDKDKIWQSLLDNKLRSKKMVCNKLAVYNSLYYIYHYVKTAIYVKIQNGELASFVRFNNDAFESNWGLYIADQLKTLTGQSIQTYYAAEQSYSNYPGNILSPQKWYLNSRLVNINEKVESQKDPHGMPEMKEILEETLKDAKKKGLVISDCEFFYNRRDHPLMRLGPNNNLIEPYNFVHPDITGKDIRIHFPKGSEFAPIASVHTDDNSADILIPSPYDWTFQKEFDVSNVTPWSMRQNICYFRGSATGAGTTIETNQRIQAMQISKIWENSENRGLLDAGITNWNIRAKKFSDTSPMDFVKPDTFPFVKKSIHMKGSSEIVSFTVSPHVPQSNFSKYKYHLYIYGHAYGSNRIPFLMSIGAVILWVQPQPEMPGKRFWYEDLLKEEEDYLSVLPDFSNLKDVILRCKSDDALCQRLSASVLTKYQLYLTRNGIISYMQTFLNQIKND